MNKAVILAAGAGTRFGKQKLLAPLWGKTVLFWSIRAFSEHPQIDQISVVVPLKNAEKLRKIAASFSKVTSIVPGGKTRFESLVKAFQRDTKLKDTDLVIIHNAANPGVSAAEISQVLELAGKYGAAGVARENTATLRHISGKHSAVLPKEKVYVMETPQALRGDIFKKGIAKWQKKKVSPTDDLELAEISGIAPCIVPATMLNRKITFAEDVSLLERMKFPSHWRIGSGEDSHRFSARKKFCKLGGIKIAAAPGFEANSDGDVVIHALCNALLSALGEGSFSAVADPLLKKGITDSAEYLQKVLRQISRKNARIQNISLVFEAKRPKLEPYFPLMRKNLSKLLVLPADAIGLTVHSGENLSPFGKGKGVKVLATVLLEFPGE